MKLFCRNLFFVLAVFLSSCTKIDKKVPHSRTEKVYNDRAVCYKPQKGYSYCKVGYASWYGGYFHGRRTASGVHFDKNLRTGAHRTLPLPCVVQVTNLDNGKKTLVLINDRGPFKETHRRIIDLSEATAKELGFHRKGLAKVSVKCLPYESMLAALYYKKKPYTICGNHSCNISKSEENYIRRIIGYPSAFKCSNGGKGFR